ncbi:hypothetical protein ACFS7Z_08790 [Pontibacter toksunensis]|uniref:Uncharacterized protein n=1 Tax=Pontibacter toksunensis TaxID=1332631 RepID=A0ABW6BWQ0_9BACT
MRSGLCALQGQSEESIINTFVEWHKGQVWFESKAGMASVLY